MLSKKTFNKRYLLSFLWQHLLLIISLFVMTLGVSLCIRSNLGSSVISSLPLSCTMAGVIGELPRWSIGVYTNLLNLVLVFIQLLILRRRFPLVQLLQIVVSVIFGALLDFNMWITSEINCNVLWSQALTQFLGCTVMGLGIAMEVRCGSVTMAGEGVPVAISRTYGVSFPTAKICIDTSLVAIAVISCYLFFGVWKWNVVGLGTLFAMFYVGIAVKMFGKKMRWFEQLLEYQPGFRRHIYGLARYIKGRF